MYNSVTLVFEITCSYGRDRIVVSTSRCGRDNPGSNPGHGSGCAVADTAWQLFLMVECYTKVLF